MAEDLDESEKQQPPTDKSQDPNGSSNSDSSRSKSSKRSRFFSFPRFKPSWQVPKFSIPKFRASQPKDSTKKQNPLWLWLAVIGVSYTCMGYFLSVLLTIRSHHNLAIAGFVIAALLPALTAFADYELMKWSYLVSGFLIVGGLVFLVRVKFYFIVLSIMVWLGITAIALVGESLIKQKRKSLIAIIILTLPCLIGLGIGHQLWKLAATMLS
jgi:hypothetical protein